MKVFLKGLNGCVMRKQKLNQYSDFLVSNRHDIVPDPHSGDRIILWTCGFREDVKKNSIDEIKRYLHNYPHKLIVAGCLPDISPESIQNFSCVVIPWKQDEALLEKIFGGTVPMKHIPAVFGEENICNDATACRKENPEKDITFHDQFIKLVVSEGCNFSCTYCSERLTFPPYRSFLEEELTEKCRQLVEKTGCYDVILLSDSLGEYGCDTGSSLIVLMEKLFSIDRRLRIALNNLNPAGFIRFQADIKKFIEIGRIRHLNLPIQSASQKILKLMNRPYTAQDIENIFQILNNLQFKEFDTHIIIGFPGETEGDFVETMEFLTRHKPKYVLASACMESGSMQTMFLPYKIDNAIKKSRLKKLYDCMTGAGIICNTDDSDLSLERLRRLNNVQGGHA